MNPPTISIRDGAVHEELLGSSREGLARWSHHNHDWHGNDTVGGLAGQISGLNQEMKAVFQRPSLVMRHRS